MFEWTSHKVGFNDMLKPIILLAVFSLGAVTGVYVFAPLIEQVVVIPIPGQTENKDSLSLASSNRNIESDSPQLSRRDSSNAVNVNPESELAFRRDIELIGQSIDIDPVDIVPSAAGPSNLDRLDADSVREVEQVHLNGRNIKEIPPELLPPASDIKLHREMELASKKVAEPRGN